MQIKGIQLCNKDKVVFGIQLSNHLHKLLRVQDIIDYGHQKILSYLINRNQPTQ